MPRRWLFILAAPASHVGWTGKQSMRDSGAGGLENRQHPGKVSRRNTGSAEMPFILPISNLVAARERGLFISPSC
jgi:hypothetical protein